MLRIFLIRHEFDSENIPDLTKDVYMQDIHCVGSLCKLYFRELPNPLLTYQLYEKFAVSDSRSESYSYMQQYLKSAMCLCVCVQECMGEMTDEERMVKVHDVIQQLPPPHYR